MYQTESKTRRRQRDSTSPLSGAETLMTSRIIKASDVSLRAGINSIEQNRKTNIADISKMRALTDSLVEDYKSDTSSDDDRPSNSVKARQRAIEAEVAERNAKEKAKLREKDLREKDRELERERIRNNANSSFALGDTVQEFRSAPIDLKVYYHEHYSTRTCHAAKI